MASPSELEIAALAQWAEKITPAAIELSTVAIVRGNKPYVALLGTGTLFSIADQGFLVTAGHVALDAMKMDASLGIGVETGVYEDRQLVKATRWGAVMRLIYSAFPDLRPSIDLYR